MERGDNMTIKNEKALEQTKSLDDCPDWTFDLLEQYQAEIDRVAKHYRLET